MTWDNFHRSNWPTLLGPLQDGFTNFFDVCVRNIILQIIFQLTGLNYKGLFKTVLPRFSICLECHSAVLPPKRRYIFLKCFYINLMLLIRHK